MPAAQQQSFASTSLHFEIPRRQKRGDAAVIQLFHQRQTAAFLRLICPHRDMQRRRDAALILPHDIIAIEDAALRVGQHVHNAASCQLFCIQPPRTFVKGMTAFQHVPLNRCRVSTAGKQPVQALVKLLHLRRTRTAAFEYIRSFHDASSSLSIFQFILFRSIFAASRAAEFHAVRIQLHADARRAVLRLIRRCRNRTPAADAASSPQVLCTAFRDIAPYGYAEVVGRFMFTAPTVDRHRKIADVDAAWCRVTDRVARQVADDDELVHVAFLPYRCRSFRMVL
nr:MAG TPA: hypothetical protein [Caudoviricetes sp.]